MTDAIPMTNETPVTMPQKFPVTLSEIASFLEDKDLRWQTSARASLAEFAELIRIGRMLTSSLVAILVVVDKLESLQMRMANETTVKFMVNGVRKELDSEKATNKEDK